MFYSFFFPCEEDLKKRQVRNGPEEMEPNEKAQTQHQEFVHIASALLQVGWRSAVSETSKHPKKNQTQTFKLQPDLPEPNFNL